jgi:hypothetical protein
MNPRLREQLTLIGFPTGYKALKEKMILLEDENRKMRATSGSALDSRLPQDSRMKALNAYVPAAAYRVQGHHPSNPTPPRLTARDILKMPKGTRPKPNKPCWTCKDLNREAFHWRDECAYKRDQPNPQQNHHRFPHPQHRQNAQRAPYANANRAPAPKPPQEPRRLPPFGGALNRPKGPRHHLRRRNDESSTNPIARATALLDTMSIENKRAFLVEQAKGLGL